MGRRENRPWADFPRADRTGNPVVKLCPPHLELVPEERTNLRRGGKTNSQNWSISCQIYKPDVWIRGLFILGRVWARNYVPAVSMWELLDSPVRRGVAEGCCCQGSPEGRTGRVRRGRKETGRARRCDGRKVTGWGPRLELDWSTVLVDLVRETVNLHRRVKDITINVAICCIVYKTRVTKAWWFTDE